jgi:hypothetical protein
MRLAVERRRLVHAVAAVAAGYCALVAVHPFFFGTGFKHLSDTKLPDRAGLGARGRQVLEALAQLVVERRFGSTLPLPLIAVLACVVPVVLLWAWWKLRGGRGGEVHSGRDTDADQPAARPLARWAVALGMWLAAVTVGLYLAGVTPAHAMSHRYLAAAWPFVALAIGILVAPRTSSRWPAGRAIATCAVALVVGTLSARLQWRKLDWHPGAPEADRLVRTADRVVIDNVGRGHWPRPIWRLREDAKVIIATPNDLLRRPAPWRRELTRGTVYISPARSAAQTREKIVQSVQKERPVREVGHLFGIGDVYVFE